MCICMHCIQSCTYQNDWGHSLLRSLSHCLVISCCQANDPGKSKICPFSPRAWDLDRLQGAHSLHIHDHVWVQAFPRACLECKTALNCHEHVRSSMSRVHIAKMGIGRAAWPWAYQIGWMYHDLPLDQDYLQLIGEQKEEDTLLAKACK